MINNILFKIALLSLNKVVVITLLVTSVYYLIYYDDGQSIKSQLELSKNTVLEEKSKEKKLAKITTDIERYDVAIKSNFQNEEKITKIVSRTLTAQEILEEINLNAKSSHVSIKEQDPQKPKKRGDLLWTPTKLRVVGDFESIMVFFKTFSNLTKY